MLGWRGNGDPYRPLRGSLPPARATHRLGHLFRTAVDAMKQFMLWLTLIAAVVTAASLAVVHFDPAASAVENLVSPGPLSPKHAYLDNRCTSCHEPTIGVTVANCTACHATSARLLGRQPTMFHASIQECSSCHIEHQRQSIRPLKMDHVELAKIGVRTLSLASRRDQDSAATLSSLETWLNIRSPGELDTSSAREGLNCAGCHDRKDPHFNRFGSDCGQCDGLANVWIRLPKSF